MVFRKRRIYLWLTLILCAPLVIILLWIAFNGLYHGPIPNEMFNVSDLPSPPPDNENGWQQIYKQYKTNPQMFSGLADDYLQQLMDDVDQVTARGPLNLAERNYLCDMVSVGGKEIDVVREKEPYQLYLYGLRQRYFRDDLSSQEGIIEKSPTLDIFYLHKLEMIHVADLICQGQYGTAAERLSALIRADRDFVLSTPILPQLLGLIMLRSDLQMAMLIVDAIAGKEGGDLRPLQNAIDAIDVNAMNPRNIVISEYLSILSLLHMVENRMIGTGDVVEGIGQVLGSRHATFEILYDRGSTLRLLNDFYSEFRDAAENPANIQMVHEAYNERVSSTLNRKCPLFWAYNPLGKIMLSVMMIDLSEQIARYAYEREVIGQIADRLRNQMNTTGVR